MALLLSFLLSFTFSFAQTDSFYLLKPDRVFDGEQMHSDWIVLVKSNKIEACGPMAFKLPANTRVINLAGTTLLPGLIEGHSHLFLHPYNEVNWNDQVLKESRAERTARAVEHARATLLAGFTTVRDLGTEGAAYDDAGLKKAIEKKIVPGPHMIIATKAIVARGAYGPNYANPDLDLPQGAAEVGNIEEMSNEARNQISKGADLIKIYADYRWGRDGQAAPTFSVEEISAATSIANSSGRQTVAHASTKEGMRRAILGGVSTIEHGDDGDEEIFRLMKEKHVALCPTLAAGEAILQYAGWKKNIDPEPARITAKKKSFQSALKNGVIICMGGDVGVFPHGDNAREMELMVEYGMKPLDVLRSSTSVNADVFGYGEKTGRIKKGLLADIIAVKGDPSKAISDVRNLILVMKEGKFYVNP
ncbi:metal-dependent hydrolase family protein [Flavisolibacter ginsengisoli]|uniref:Imidazolonepropionase n=1 Tax=Flavisolibacter ginsengisoli DSM 18119 TaxID=1121884 RepID=A0A1M5BEX1_9BACT|nr:amidohydrolase family protein [Flavisolibacter ginsengisoli]SHF41044.1 Imidazolonepropionase [Flavisolibacter ginsengisoli DSM 18119]